MDKDLEKLASDPRAKEAGELIQKIAHDAFMRSVQIKLAEDMAAEPGAEGTDPTDEDLATIEAIAEMIQEDPESVPDDLKEQFVEAIMQDPSMQEEVKEAMTKKEAYKQEIRSRMKVASLVKLAEDTAVSMTPEGEEVPQELVEAVLEILVEGEGGEEAPAMEPEPFDDEAITEDDITDDEIMAALEADGEPIEEEDTREMKAAKVARLALRHKNAGHTKTAALIYSKYLKQ